MQISSGQALKWVCWQSGARALGNQTLTSGGIDQSSAKSGRLGGAEGRIRVTGDDETCSSKRRLNVSADITLFLLPRYGQPGVREVRTAILTELKARADAARGSGGRRGGNDDLHRCGAIERRMSLG